MEDSLGQELVAQQPVNTNRVAPILDAIVKQIQARDQCSRMKALHRAIDEYPLVYADYLADFERR